MTSKATNYLVVDHGRWKKLVIGLGVEGVVQKNTTVGAG